MDEREPVIPVANELTRRDLVRLGAAGLALLGVPGGRAHG